MVFYTIPNSYFKHILSSFILHLVCLEFLENAEDTLTTQTVVSDVMDSQHLIKSNIEIIQKTYIQQYCILI